MQVSDDFKTSKKTANKIGNSSFETPSKRQKRRARVSYFSRITNLFRTFKNSLIIHEQITQS